jgi:hypothetical protein
MMMMMVIMMMMIVHQMRYGRQDNHATNHARCTKMSMAGQRRRHIEAKQSETITSQTRRVKRLAKHGKSTPSMLMGEAQLLGTGARKPECEQTRKGNQER